MQNNKTKLIYLLSFVETPRKFIIAELSIRKLGSSSVLIIIISTDEDPSLRIESSAIINLRGVSTKLNKYIVFTMQTYKKLKTKLSVYYANARSIVNKIDLFHLEITERSYDIIALTETHLYDSILDSEIFPCNYTVFRRDRLHNGRHGGRILLATRDNVEAIMKEDFLITYIS